MATTRPSWVYRRRDRRYVSTAPEFCKFVRDAKPATMFLPPQANQNTKSVAKKCESQNPPPVVKIQVISLEFFLFPEAK